MYCGSQQCKNGEKISLHKGNNKDNGFQAETRLTCLQNSKASVAREMSEEEKETYEMISEIWPDHVGLFREPTY